MPFEHKIDSGSLFRNEKKTESSHPDYRGSAKISSPGGEVFEVWVSGWINEAKSGKKYMSLRFNEKKDEPSSPVRRGDDDFDDDVPF